MLPFDTVECVKWCRDPQLDIFATGDWNGDVTFYRVHSQNDQSYLDLMNRTSLSQPILNIDWSFDSKALYVGVADGNI